MLYEVITMPFEQLGLIRMGREAVDRMDASAYRNRLAEDRNRRGAVDDLSRERALRRVADEDHAALLASEVLAQVMPHAPARAHPRAGHDDGAPGDPIDRDRLRRLPRETQLRDLERIATALV